MVIIRRQLVASRLKTFQGTNGRKYITIHETGNPDKGANAKMHANLQANGFSASWHWQVDDREAIQSFPHTVRCWHAGDGAGAGNFDSIGIEICINADGNYRKALENAAVLVRQIMHEENIPLSRVVQHNKWNGKNCPRHLRAGDKGITWISFKQLIQGGAFNLSSSVLTYGSKGAAVEKLQKDLNNLGFTLVVDGSFGPLTAKALKTFQTSHHLMPDASYGPITQKVLQAAINGLHKSGTDAPKPTGQISNKILKYGDKGDEVIALQKALASVYFFPNKKASNYGIDGSFGPKTLDALKRFQSVYTPAEVDGIFGPKTQAALRLAIKNKGK